MGPLLITDAEMFTDYFFSCSLTFLCNTSAFITFILYLFFEKLKGALETLIHSSHINLPYISMDQLKCFIKTVLL